MHRFFAPSLDPGDDTVTLPHDEAEHLTRVLRLSAGDTVGVFDGRGHDVRVVRLPRHGASCPVAIAVSCSADRQALGKITTDGIFLEQLETDPAQYLPETTDADLDEEVNAVAFGAFMFQGQICMSTERVVVDRKVADDFVARLGKKAELLPTGNPRNGNVVLGPLISTDAAQRVDALVKEAVDKGATLVAGGKVDGPVMSATVLDHVTRALRIYHEESFGPVAPVTSGGPPPPAPR